MLDPKKVEDIARQIGSIIPPQLKQFADELEGKVKQVLQAKLSELDFVSREEFDVQRQVLLRTREKVEAMEQQLAALLAEKTQDFSKNALPSSDQE
ncbi:accessory factor UbiK family protein [Alishewanella sp. 16-MA]|uniref:Ubiquinone biosynthesis accessory factor UbiK n=1 Tax=Alishewanella maricola TaxID=2795740 RepID=A0ABS8C2V1_9ALTE|nr:MULTISPECIES: accessory factor UbiK family protein [Gammaproteobacteria]MDP4945202.1 accessory factor UbiK family protein [Alishewanella sp.]MCB5226455.1 accessory factor UbiK family protein [Alishewanella maricola]MCC5450536.1 accessory factor UbiK family protein [Rheinheimera sp. UJ51]MCF4008804.1 accessory factor UbiK family protein [Rheinheimera sp. UJ63]MDP5036577.1 accessory factor UbiK family protein [Alishewanella sp.]